MKNLIISKKHLLLMLSMLAFAACSEDSEPTCESAVPHYYDSGCVFTVDGDAVAQSTILTSCQNAETTAESNTGCDEKMKIVLSCMENVPDAASLPDCQVCVSSLVEAITACQ